MSRRIPCRSDCLPECSGGTILELEHVANWGLWSHYQMLKQDHKCHSISFACILPRQQQYILTLPELKRIMRVSYSPLAG